MGRAPCCDKANVKKGAWCPEEDAKLKSYIEQHGTGGNWITLPQKIGLRRCGKSCRLRWLNYLRPNIKHGSFTEEEDEAICRLYRAIGSRWSIIAAKLPGRTDNDIKNYWNTKLKKKLLGAKCNDNRHSANDQLDTCSETKKAIKTKESNHVHDSSCSSLRFGAEQQTSQIVHLHDMIAPWHVEAALLHVPPPASSDQHLVQTQEELPLQPIEKSCNNLLMELETTTSDSSYRMPSNILDDGIDQNAALLNMSWCEVTSLICPQQQCLCDIIDQSTCILEVEEKRSYFVMN